MTKCQLVLLNGYDIVGINNKYCMYAYKNDFVLVLQEVESTVGTNIYLEGTIQLNFFND